MSSNELSLLTNIAHGMPSIYVPCRLVKADRVLFLSSRIVFPVSCPLIPRMKFRWFLSVCTWQTRIRLPHSLVTLCRYFFAVQSIA